MPDATAEAASRETGRTGDVEEIPAADGFPLAATLHPPPGPADGLVLVAPATGVRRRLYAELAGHLAGRGLLVVTWDWRGTGDSLPAERRRGRKPALRGFEANLLTWARSDLAGVLAWAEAEHPGLPTVVLGHSFGGQAVGLVPASRQLAGLVTVAAQSGYWGHWPWPGKLLYALLWHVAMPGLTRLLGYFPSRRLGLGEDLPPGVALEWARWCRTPAYLPDWRGHGALSVPVLSYSFSDDAFAPRPAVESLHRRYGGPVERRHLAPAELGVEEVGHFGYFRPGLPGLWDETAEWVLGRSGSADRPS